MARPSTPRSSLLVPNPFALLRRAVQLMRRPALVRRYLRDHAKPRLQIGCGKQAIEGWLNADLVPCIPGVVLLDARHRFPFPNDCFQIIFSEHLIEHLSYEEGEHMLREAFRSLEPGGTLRVATPDLRFLIDLHRSSPKTPLQERYLDWALRHANLTDPGEHREVAVINHFFRGWNHRFIYDFETLATLLRRVGFHRIEQRAVGDSAFAELRGLESHGKVIPEDFNRIETFVVEAHKPERSGR